MQYKVRVASMQTQVSVDEDCVPIEPTWSIKSRISRQSHTPLSEETFMHLHKLSALQPPTDAAARSKLKSDLEGMIQMVEGVKACPLLPDISSGNLPDGRIWPEDIGMELNLDWQMDRKTRKKQQALPMPSILHLTKKTKDGKYYVGPAANKRKE